MIGCPTFWRADATADSPACSGQAETAVPLFRWKAREADPHGVYFVADI
jgi:hypothetical protein